MRIARSLSWLAAGVLLASCVAHGAGESGNIPEQNNFTPYDEWFYEDLLSDRVWIFRKPARRSYRNVPHFMIFRADGQRLRCTGRWRTRNNLDWIGDELARWSVVRTASGAVVRFAYEGRKPGYAHFFYDPATGITAVELFRSDAHWRRAWSRGAYGWVQDSLPRSLADACPGLDLPAGMRINEKQTAQRLDELRRQDPDAPIRNFPGSRHRCPGCTGLGASGGKPTTTKAEVEAYLAAQEGNILRASKGGPYTYVRSGDGEEFWRIGHGNLADKYFDVVRSEDGTRWTMGKYVYVFGYPFGYVPTGHRHPAFQITDELIRQPYPRALEFMDEAYADRRFVFHREGRSPSRGRFSVVDEAGNLVEGPHFDGVWRWTRGRLEMTVRDDPAGPRSIGWRELASDLGIQLKVWSRFTPNAP